MASSQVTGIPRSIMIHLGRHMATTAASVAIVASLSKGGPSVIVAAGSMERRSSLLKRAALHSTEAERIRCTEEEFLSQLRRGAEGLGENPRDEVPVVFRREDEITRPPAEGARRDWPIHQEMSQDMGFFFR